jgi:hypothetical protein
MGCLHEDESKVCSRRYVEGEEGIGKVEVRGEVGASHCVRERSVSLAVHEHIVILMKPSILM